MGSYYRSLGESVSLDVLRGKIRGKALSEPAYRMYVYWCSLNNV